MEDYMKAIRQKRSTKKGLDATTASVSEQLKEIQAKLEEMGSVLNRTTPSKPSRNSRPSTDVTRYLSEPKAATYTLTRGKLGGPEETIEFCNRHFRSLIDHSLQEEMHLLTLNGNHRVIRSHQITVGLLNSTQVHPREIFRPAILDSSAAIILVHNHPSGNCEPSLEDLKVTEAIEAAAKIMGIKLLDHIVVARDRSVSIFEWREGRRPPIG